MNDKEKLQYLYEKEKAKEEKQERKQGNVLFAGGMVAYLFIAAFKIVVMSFFPLLFFYFILGIGGMSLIILSLIAGAIFFYIKEGKDIKEEMGNRAMMEEVRNGHPSYKEEESEDNMTEAEEKMADMLEDNFTKEQKRKMGLISEENNKFDQKSLYIRKSISNAGGLALLLEIDKAFKSMPVVKNYLERNELESVEDIPLLREKFYIPLADDAKELGRIIDECGFNGVTIKEEDTDILENWKKAINDESLPDNIFNQIIREAMRIARRELYNETIYVLGSLKKHFDYNSEKEWRNHIRNIEEKEEQNLRKHGARHLTENEKREMGLIS